MDIVTILLIIIASFNAFLGSAILLHGPKKKSDKRYAIIVSMLVLWAVNLIILRLTNNPYIAFYTLAVSHLSGMGIAISFWYFVGAFAEMELGRIKPYLVWFSASALAVAVFVSDKFIVSITSIQSVDKQLAMGPIHYAYSAFFAVVMTHAFYMLYRAHIKTDEPGKKNIFELVFVGTFITSLFGSIFNIFLLDLGISDYISWGPITTVIMVVFITYAIMKYNLMNIRMIGSELLAILMIITAGARLLFSVTTQEYIINAIYALVAMIFGLMLIRSVMRESNYINRIEGLASDLKTSNEKLQELDRLKSEFLSFASHQIKAPLGAIKGFATLIYDGTYGPVPEKVSDASHKIKESADRMVQLVTDFLNVRKIEEGKMILNFEKVDAVKMTKELFEELKPLANNKNLEFILESDEKPLYINADLQGIRQVFLNLIDNAIKYTDGGFVKIKAGASGNNFLFSVSDSGHGISRELLPHLFEEFRRDSKERQIEGTGLGLYIAKGIALSHKGRAWADSEGHGKGSTFFVEIPLFN